MAGPPRVESGFTLLEVCFVLFIVAVLFAVAAPPTARLFRRAIAPAGPRTAKLRQRSEAIRDRRKSILRTLVAERPFYLEQRIASGRPTTRNGYQLPSDVTFAIKRLNDTGFGGSADARWIFLPNGLCEPITFLFQRGPGWIKFRIDPLTVGLKIRSRTSRERPFGIPPIQATGASSNSECLEKERFRTLGNAFGTFHFLHCRAFAHNGTGTSR